MIRACIPGLRASHCSSNPTLFYRLAVFHFGRRLARQRSISSITLDVATAPCWISGYSVRRLFDAACRVADVEPNILLESRAPHTLLALAEAGQGVAIIPSVLRIDRYRLRVARVTHRRKPLRDRFVIQWDKRRPMTSYAQNFCAALAAYMREVLPITRPSSR